MLSARTRTELARSCACSCCLRRSTHPQLEQEPKLVRVTLSATDKDNARPSALRSSLKYPMPRAMRLAGLLRNGNFCPSTVMFPACGVCNPKSARNNSVRPDPIRPAMPSISPRRTCRLALRTCKYGAERYSASRSEEHTSELQSPDHLVCPLLLEKKKKTTA